MNQVDKVAIPLWNSLFKELSCIILKIIYNRSTDRRQWALLCKLHLPT